MAAISVTAANVVLVSGDRKSGIAGETITAGKSLYINTSNSDKLHLADADALLTSVFAGIALGGASANQPVFYAGPGCVVNMGGTVAVGTVYMVGLTAGDVLPDAEILTGDYVSIIGVGETAANLRISPINSGIARA